MCSQDLRPFAMVEGQGFINVAQELLDIGSKYGGSILAEDVLPCARTVSRHVEGEYDKVKSDVVEELKQEFGITVSNVVAAFKDYRRLSCAGHNINLILKHVFDHLDEDNPMHSIIINLLKESKTLVTHFKRAGLQKELELSLKQAVETRWNTRLAMLQSVNDALKSGKLHDILLRRRELRFLKNIDSELLEDIIQVLIPFDEATRHLSTDKAPTLHLVLPTKATLLRGLLIQDGDSVIVKELKGKLAQAVELKFKIHLYHKVATALSPSLRSFLRKTLNAQEYEEVIDTLTALTETTGAEERGRVREEKEGAPPEAGTTEVHDFYAGCVEEEEREEDSGEMQSWGRQLVLQYMSDPKMTRSQSLLDVWQEKSGGLVPVAKKLLAIPATSTPSERSFSVAGRLIEERRTSLNPENVDALLFLHSNI
ncbi:hypothetical protein SKAU_G00234600 [Synaphobranchus kaupii]|uniref:HAT C-terminal dimerisation domain-containing protein n=1 Tax=Synaphobranchus kaupii TaxID=118154 RepID=A0A9Q1ITL7_SYNKA|nr:hypothetical protein SKAU_G00234600 [Synaphobranchus kaupii]